MRIIKKKTWPEYFELVLKGKKKFEIRLADFNIQEGDILELEEYDPKTKAYTGRSIRKKAGKIFNTKLMEQMHKKEDIEKYGLYIIQLEDER